MGRNTRRCRPLPAWQRSPGRGANACRAASAPPATRTTLAATAIVAVFTLAQNSIFSPLSINAANLAETTPWKPFPAAIKLATLHVEATKAACATSSAPFQSPKTTKAALSAVRR